MESDEDNHLCLRCGLTIIGLDNYVSHRRQQCCKRNLKSDSPFLSDASALLTSVDSSAKEDLQESFANSDISKLTANDFFLSLNLQSTANLTSCSQKALNNAPESFCSKLCFPPLESDLENAFSEEKELPDSMLHESSNIGMMILNDKLESYKCQDHAYPNEDFHESEFSSNIPNGSGPEKSFCNSVDLSSSTIYSSTKNSIGLREEPSKQISTIPTFQKQRTSLRQATNTNSDIACCEMLEIPFNCPLCNDKYSFTITYLNHLLVCAEKSSRYDQWTEEVFRRSLLFIRNMPFVCRLCSFYCNHKSIFLEHLKNSSHRQNAAKLKIPLICLPCEIEFSASDDMKNHFFKVHFQCKNELHPIIVSKLRKNLHCCYCLNIVKGCIYLLSANNFNFNPLSQDGKVIKSSMKIIFECSYGIDKSLLDSYMKLLKCFSVMIKYETPNNLCLETFEKFENKYKVVKNHKNLAKKSEVLKRNSENVLVNTFKINPKESTNKIKKRATKAWTCFSCKSRHSSKNSFDKHLKYCSTDERQLTNNFLYLCDICGYKSKKFHELTKHERSHTGSKPFKCPDCDISFSLSSQLLRHKRLHTGVKPYRCLYCPYVCNTQENLRKHVLKTKKHEGKTMYPCKNCNFGCNEFDIYKKHLLNSHSDIFPDEKSVSSSAVAGLYDN